ncbi:hypothetical protein PGT21_030329 [Puccinia graminis f. sp. tritici]|uniref:Uncharacterized protein n=1 Tax=Puccinia graminis f. sp. tritici TaxID=56615 RepID=A0A5B0M8N9_PUCGR|nr:hypothetical protein PGT21_030329 [Puccinia graminis f. sp. tritici]
MRESLSASHVSPRQVFMAGQNWGDNLAGRTVWQLFQDSSVPNSIGLSPTDLRNSTVPGCLLPPEVTISNPSSLPHLEFGIPPEAVELLITGQSLVKHCRSQLAYNRVTYLSALPGERTAQFTLARFPVINLSKIVHPAAFRKTKIEKNRKLQFFSSDLKDCNGDP